MMKQLMNNHFLTRRRMLYVFYILLNVTLLNIYRNVEATESNGSWEMVYSRASTQIYNTRLLHEEISNIYKNSIKFAKRVLQDEEPPIAVTAIAAAGAGIGVILAATSAAWVYQKRKEASISEDRLQMFDIEISSGKSNQCSSNFEISIQQTHQNDALVLAFDYDEDTDEESVFHSGRHYNKDTAKNNNYFSWCETDNYVLSKIMSSECHPHRNARSLSMRSATLPSDAASSEGANSGDIFHRDRSKSVCTAPICFREDKSQSSDRSLKCLQCQKLFTDWKKPDSITARYMW